MLTPCNDLHRHSQSVNLSGFTAKLRLHYLDSERTTTPETNLNLRRFNGTGWAPYVATTPGGHHQQLELRTMPYTTSRSGRSSTFAPTATGGDVSGRIVDSNGRPVEGAVVRLSGRKRASSSPTRTATTVSRMWRRRLLHGYAIASLSLQSVQPQFWADW